jgi:SAM-dependent methyltransferase
MEESPALQNLDEARRIIGDLERELHEYRSGNRSSSYFTKFPPASLAWRVGGADSNGNVYPDFLISGFQVVHNILAILARQGLGSKSFNRILDFGCGCGRVIRFLAYERFEADLVGCDIDPEAISWCRDNIDFPTFIVSPFHPPLPFRNEHFDFIYSISIFTHLSEQDQFAWLAELERVIRPGGIVIITTQGKNKNYERLSDDVKRQLERDGIWYDEDNVYFEDNKTYGFKFPKAFKLTYHTHSYIHRLWSKYFEILEISDRAVCHDQDAVVLRKR